VGEDGNTTIFPPGSSANGKKVPLGRSGGGPSPKGPEQIGASRLLRRDAKFRISQEEGVGSCRIEGTNLIGLNKVLRGKEANQHRGVMSGVGLRIQNKGDRRTNVELNGQPDINRTAREFTVGGTNLSLQDRLFSSLK